jgi:tRNA uridine 5-carbamoylmethylation protein Kti12
MQSVLNFSSPLRHTLIVGAPCSGKDFLASHAIKTLKQQRPSVLVYVIDIKADPKES